ncbi:little elongation complex subunit 1 isoform X2 [Eupeodes corollae]|uniref:little elongation complex subunit 1 isoform X2 n=1 Tax=Eupeodes corollae TaxID=290404 RepID=UPI002490C5B0|nr:little elongation complex subunit 1 isoform X2 [Eupeodes corollae]
MEDNVEPYSFDLNLDFLDSTATNIKNATITPQYQDHSQTLPTYDIESLASRIASVNDMAIQIKATKDDNLRLQKQMQDLSESAMSIRAMYDQEKTDRLKFEHLYCELKEKYEHIESQLANKSLHFEQIQSKMELEAEDKKPITYCELALKYQRLALHHEEEKQLPSKEKVVVQLVKEYLESKKLSPLPALKKKSQSRVKSDMRDFSMQYNYKVESKQQESQCSIGCAEDEPKDTCTQGTQYTWYTTTRGTNTPAFISPKAEVKTQGTQYISSTTTRGTSTSTFIKTQSVGTNFPEPVPPVSIEDIFKEMIYNVAPLSPMSANSQAELKEEKVEMKSIGTCTDLKNVRKLIDYAAVNIKHSDSRPPSRNSNMYDHRIKNEIPLMGMPTLNPFAGLGIPVTPMHNTVTELWNMLGHTIFALLQQNNGTSAAQLNPIHMNVLNDRMRNLTGRSRPPSEQQRNCEPQTRDDYFEQDYSGEYPPATRSAATSPILPSELENNQTQSRPLFDSAMRTLNQTVDIQKIVLNKNFSDSVVSSSRKSSQVDEILQLFPEYSDSFKKRKAIKRLLKEANKNTKPKKKRNSNSCSSSISASTQFSPDPEVQQRPVSSSPVSASPQPSMEMPETKPHLQANWKTEIFGDCDSDSSLDNSVMEYIKAHTPQPDPEDKWTPIDYEPPPPPNHLDRPINSSSFEAEQNMEKDFLGFVQEINLPKTADELFCKPFSPPKGQKSVFISGSSIQKIQQRIEVNANNLGGLLNTEIESNELAKPPNSKRKRKPKKPDSNQPNTIYKLDETPIFPNPKTPPEPKKIKRSLSLNKNKVNVESILPIQPSTSSTYKPLQLLNLNKIKKLKQDPKQHMCGSQNQTIEAPKKTPTLDKPDWMNRIKDQEKEDIPSIHVTRNNHGPMVMKVEKPPDSVFQDIKNCFITPKQEGDTFIGPIMPIPAAPKENSLLPEQTAPLISPTEDGTFRFVIQNNANTIHSNVNSSNNPIEGPEKCLKILNCYSSESAEKKSVAFLNEQFKETKKEVQLTTGVSLASDNKALDLENMPIYFLDDQNMLQHGDEPEKDNLNLKTPHETMLPGFEEIQRGLKNVSAQLVEKLQKPGESQTNNSPVIVQGYPFKDNCKTTNAIESTLPGLEVRPKASKFLGKMSYLAQKHQKQFDEQVICKDLNLNRIDEELGDTNNFKNETVDRVVLSSLHGNLKDPCRPTNHKPEKSQDIEISSSNLLLQNLSSFGSNLLLPPTYRESLSRKSSHKTPRFVEMQATAVSDDEASNIPNSALMSNESKDPSTQNKIDCEPPVLNKDDISSLSSSSDGEDLSTILKTPEKTDNPEVQFKTPDSFPKNDSIIGKVMTNSTEKLVEEYLLNESPGEEGPKFQVFLDRILDDVAPPTSPISALASSEKPTHSEAESSCDESASETAIPIKYKRKAAATSAIAVKRSARISARQISTTKNVVNSLCSMTIPNIELGKYTKRKTEKQPNKQDKLVKPVKEDKIDIKMGFFREAMDEEDEEPICEPIRRHSVEEIKIAHESLPKRLETEVVQSKSEEHKQSSFPQKFVSYPSSYNNAQQSISLNHRTEESNNVSIDDSSSICKNSEVTESLSYESPASPPPPDRMPTTTHAVLESFELLPISKEDSSPNRKTIISHLIANYNKKCHNMLDKGQTINKALLAELERCIKEYLKAECRVIDTIRFVDAVIELTSDDKIVSKAIVNVLKTAPRPETEVTVKIPDTYLSQTHRKLLTALQQLCYHYPNLHYNLQSTIEQSMFTFTKEVITVEVLLNLTQFYLAIINNPTAGTTNPARLFICKCLYFYNVKAIPLIYHTLCVYPTVLPQKTDPTYDRSDILISTIQSILMSTYYDPEKCDFMSRQILAKLRMFYNYESFKPPRDEVIENMMAKIRAGRFKNVSYALSVICKRMEQPQTEKFILNERLMPLANEYYHTFSQSSENDEKIACVLECISFVIKPFAVNTDISQYVNLFGRFLNAASDRKVVQEASVAAILRTARFGYVQCFNAIYNFKPTYELSENLKLMLRSFVYKKGIAFLNALERQAQELLAP